MNGFGHTEHGSEVGVHDPVELLLGHTFDSTVVGDAGIVNQDVYFAKVGQYLFHEVLGSLIVGDIGNVPFGLDTQSEELFFDGNHGIVTAPATESHIGAFTSKSYSNSVTDATGGTGHDCGLI